MLTLPPVEAAVAADRPRAQVDASVSTVAVKPVDRSTPVGDFFTPPEVRWPAAATAELALGPAAVSPTAAKTLSGTKVGGMPVSVTAVAPTKAPERMSAADELARVRVEVLDHAQSEKAGVDGVLLRVQRTDGASSTTTATVALDYSAFQYAYGADWSSRLRFMTLSDCALDAPAKTNCQGQSVPTTNDGNGIASAEIPMKSTSTLVALAADQSSDNGTFAATSLQPSSTWSVSGNSGSFNWSYPMRVPAPIGGDAPQVSLGYSSQSVDGRMSASNTQPSWVGEGFEYSPGYIERKYKTCREDKKDGNNTTDAGDLCWVTDNATMSLGGQSTELLSTEPAEAYHGEGKWRTREDNGSRVERKLNRDNGDNDGEYWVVTNTDGTQYWFGSRSAANSTLTVPVYGNHDGEPCHAAAFADSACGGKPQAWRWNLDFVVDPHKNTRTYVYAKETNKYARNLKTTDLAEYDRGSYLTRIDYGSRDGEAGTAPFRISFTPGDRCVTSCWTSGKPNKSNWPDTPWDQECKESPCLKPSPSFWTTQRLAKVTTQLWSGTTDKYNPVDSWTLNHKFPDITDGSHAGLWLDSITHTGHTGGTDITLPNVTFAGEALPNRVDSGSSDPAPAMKWWRLKGITTETGATIGIQYKPSDCSRPGGLPAEEHDNPKRCYPVRWTPDGAENPINDWFHKYVVDYVTESDSALPAAYRSPRVVTSYDYVGAPAWHYTDDDGLVDKEDKTWSVWRGYDTVRVTKGDPGQQHLTEYRYFRGMDGDKQPSGKRSVTLPAVGTYAPAVKDDDVFAGIMRTSVTKNGTTQVSGQVQQPWHSAPTATRTINGDTVEAVFTGMTATWSWTALPGGKQRVTGVRNTMDSYGMTQRVDALGDIAVTGDETCSITTYEPRNIDAWLVKYPHRAQHYATSCSAATDGRALSTDDVISDTWTWYDTEKSRGSAGPTKADPVKTESLYTWSKGSGNGDPGTPGYRVTATRTYDKYGRLETETDVKNRLTRTEYTHNSGGQTVGLAVINPVGWRTTSVLEPAYGQPIKTTDPNDRVTEKTYDSLGRLTQVWPATRNRASGQTPQIKYTYTVRNNAASAVTTSALDANGNYRTAVSLFDSLLRPRQTQVEDTPEPGKAQGRIITDNHYDTAGRNWESYNGFVTDGAPEANLRFPESETQLTNVTSTKFDGVGRPIQTSVAGGGKVLWSTTTAYGGDRVTVTPPDGGTATTTVQDAQGRTIAVRQYKKPADAGSDDPQTYTAISYAYNRKGQLWRETDALGNAWTHTFDVLGRQTQSIDPDKGVTESFYNEYDELDHTRDARGTLLYYGYDTLGRKTSLRENTAGGPLRAAWTYDTIQSDTTNPPTTMSVKGYATKTVRYDNRGTSPAAYVNEVAGFTPDYRPTGAKITVPATLTGLAGTYRYAYTYKANGAPASTTVPQAGTGAGRLNRETLTYQYDAQGEANTVKTDLSASGDPVFLINGTSYTRFREIGVVGYRYDGGKGIDTQILYDQYSRRVKQTKVTRATAPATILDQRYTRNDFGNITGISDVTSSDHQCFRHDYLQRLTEAWTPQAEGCTPDPSESEPLLGGPDPYWQSWTYDEIGNRLTSTTRTAAGRTTSNYTYPVPEPSLPEKATYPHAVKRIVTTGAETADTAYGYDEAGNTISRGDDQTLAWDPEGHLQRVGEADGDTTYLYGTDGSRMIADDPKAMTLYLPGQEVRYDKTTKVANTTRHYQHGGQVVASRTAKGLSWLINDHLGTALQSVDDKTQAVTPRRHLPFGATRPANTAWTVNKLGFVGGNLDDTGLTHLGAREYDPKLGRFISVDPIIDLSDPQQWNAYAYSNNSPISYSDPSGETLGSASCPPGMVDSSSGCTGGENGTANAKGQGGYNESVETYDNGTTHTTKPGGNNRINNVEYPGWETRPIYWPSTEDMAKALDRYKGDHPVMPCPCVIDQDDDDFTTAMILQAKIKGYLKVDPRAEAEAFDTRLYAKAGNLAGDANGFGHGPVMAGRVRMPAGGVRIPRIPNTCRSFSGETRVLMEGGTSRAIEDLKPGDKVIARDPRTGKATPRQVSVVWSHEDEMSELRLDSGTIVTTEDHPFWSLTEGRWNRADELDLGELILTADGQGEPVRGLDTAKRPGTAVNLTVDDLHTYYVLVGDVPVLVHNAAPEPDPFGVPRVPGVYIITLDTGEQYVGQGKNISERWRQHFSPKGTLTKANFTRENIAGIEYRLPGPGISLNQLESEVFDEFGGKAKLPYNTNNPTMYKLFGTGPGGKCG
ncbi:RHS repeat-associated core domain-containing protein [Actinoplanes sp. NPDC049668]|uniref:RHS repeat-associated core domain-containing protein n=1 Tax=unclassified Actinoplanes TaxID=2626549 RepID=UPI0033A976D5